MLAIFHQPPRYLTKIGLCLALIITADQLFFWHAIGSTIGVFMVMVTLAIAFTNRVIFRDRGTQFVLASVAALALTLFENPTILGFMLMCAALWLMVLLPRHQRFDDAWRWTRRIAIAICLSYLQPLQDLLAVQRSAKRTRSTGLTNYLRLLIMPMFGSAAFLALFAIANPLIARVLGELDPLPWISDFSAWRVFFWGVMGLFVWGWLRPAVRASLPSHRPQRSHRPETRDHRAMITISLAAFNLVFALQNILDIIFLWSGAPLPDGVTLADYAHQGAYPLIATAVLAGLFVLIALQPGSGLESNKRVRGLVYVWITQNIMLVASSILRTLDYIEVYSLTELRLAALIWMALVGLGLALICFRIITKRSGAWLINANAAAALIVVTSCTVIDLREVTARWNISHNLEVTGEGVLIDRAYLYRLGASAIVPLSAAIANNGFSASYRNDLHRVQAQILTDLTVQQSDWHSWTWRNACRLAASEQIGAQARAQPLTAETNQ